MPLTLTDIANKTARITLRYEEFSFWVEYYPKKVTLKAISDVQAGGEDVLIETVSRLIKAWDIYEDRENTIMTPITPSRLRELPYDLLVHIVESVVRELRPEALAPQMNGKA